MPAVDIIDMALDEIGRRGASNVTRAHVSRFVQLAEGNFDMAIDAIVDIANGRTNVALRDLIEQRR